MRKMLLYKQYNSSFTGGKTNNGVDDRMSIKTPFSEAGASTKGRLDWGFHF
jgi:hypothetical protein